MLAYAYRPLQKEDYKYVSTEEFDNVLDLLSRILVIGLNRLIKQGFFRDYIRKTESGSSIRGKINLKDSIKLLSSRKKQLNFSYNEYSLNNYLNQIIKSTLLLLIKSEIKPKTKKNIRRILLYFSNVDTLDLRSVDWKIRYFRNNQEYEMLINFCYLTINGLLQTEEDGTLKLMNFSDKFLYALYEAFVYNYYYELIKNDEYNSISVSKPHLKWPLNNPLDNENNLLPTMRTDIVLSINQENRFLIIDTKYYGKIFPNYWDKYSFKSSLLYQIFTYVKSKEFEFKDGTPHEVSGMLLYAATDEINGELREKYMMDGNWIYVQTLDLNKDFEDIENQLKDIANNFLKAN